MSRVTRRSWPVRFAGLALIGLEYLFRLLFICGCILGSAALVLLIIDRLGLWLDGAVVPGWILALAAVTVLFACFLRYGSVIRRPGPDDERGFLVCLLRRVPLMLRLVATGAIGAALMLLPLRPTNGNIGGILVDNYSPNTPSVAVPLLTQAVEAYREAKSAGCETRFDTPRMESIVIEAERSGTTPALAIGFMDEMKTLRPLNDRLAEVDASLKDRRRDRVFVVSSHRGPEVGVQPWPLDPSRIRCSWKTPPEVIGAASATKPRIVRYHYTMESAMESVLELNLEVPDGFEFPSLAVRLHNKGAEVWSHVFTPPSRNHPWQPNASKNEAYGRYGDRCCYRLLLPRLGDSMTLRLTGPDWDANEIGVPQFDGNEIPLGPRVLVFRTAGAELEPLTRLKPLAVDPKEPGPPPVLFDPPGPLPASGGKPVKLVVGPLPAPPPSDEPTVEILASDLTAKNPGPATLYREPVYFGTDLGLVWVEPSWASGMPLLGEGIDLSESRNRRVHVVSTREGQTVGPVVFQRDGVNRPGHVTVVLPRLDDIDEWPRQRQQMVSFLLTFAGSLAERNGSTRPAYAGEILVPSDGMTILASESGPPSDRSSLAWQVIGALRGDLDNRRPEWASNTISAELIAQIAAIVILLLAPACMLSWIRTVRMRRAGLTD